MFKALSIVAIIFVTSKILTDGQEEDVLKDFLNLSNLDEIRSYFRNSLDPIANKTLEIFEKDCLYVEDPGIPKGRRRPFVVIEGDHRPSRDVIGMKLARRLHGRYLSHPAPCLHKHFQNLPKGSTIRRVFYRLSVYALVYHAKIQLNLNRAVVLNGYWWEQVTFSLLQTLPANASLPTISSAIFKAPEDLMQPDLIIYMNHPVKMNGTGAEKKRRCLELYRGLQSKYPITIQPMREAYRLTNDEVYTTVRNNLSYHRDFRIRNVFDY